MVELRDSLRKKLESGSMQRGAAATCKNAVDTVSRTAPAIAGFTAEMRDAREALMGLGIKDNDAFHLLQQISKKHEDSTQWNAQRWIKTALTELGNGSRN